MTDGPESTTRLLLTCGILFGVLFYLLVAVQAATRPGYDITQHPISLLALGEMGWVQTANFVATGVLALAAAVGIRRHLGGQPGGTWTPALVALFGVGILLAGVFPADPSLGFPPGTPEGVPEELSTTSQLHGLGFMVAFGSLTAACFVIARRWARVGRPRARWWAIGVGVVTPLMIVAGMAFPAATSELFALAGIPPFALVGAFSKGLRGW